MTRIRTRAPDALLWHRNSRANGDECRGGSAEFTSAEGGGPCRPHQEGPRAQRLQTDRCLRSRRRAPKLVACALCLALGAGTLAHAHPARAEPASERARAREHFNQGLTYARAAAYVEALEEFTRAYRIAPHFSVLYNIGQTELALERPRAAVETLRRYLLDGGEQIDRARRAEVQETIARELERLGPVDTPSVPLRPADPAAGEESRDSTPPAPAVGAASAANTARASGAPDCAQGQAPGNGCAPIRNSRVEPAVAPRDSRRTLSYVIGGAGLVLASAALAHYAWNHRRYEEWQHEYAAYHRDPRSERRDSANQLAESVERASRVTIGLAIGAGVTLGSGTVLLLSSGSATAPVRGGTRETWLSVRAPF
jgi:tetratricopeptide (TPR) repeat protein